MTLQEVVMILAVIYLSFWILMVIGIGVMAYLAYRRFKNIKQDLAARGSALFTATTVLQLLPWKKLVPMLAAAPFLTKIFQLVSRRVRKS